MSLGWASRTRIFECVKNLPPAYRRKEKRNEPKDKMPLLLMIFYAFGSGVQPTIAMEALGEPANALSLPTWAIHVSSVMEWWICMGLVWEIGSVGRNPSWKSFSWGMLPLLGGAMCACTWHVFYNSADLNFLVALQAAFTCVGNATLWYSASRLVQTAKEQGE